MCCGIPAISGLARRRQPASEGVQVAAGITARDNWRLVVERTFPHQEKIRGGGESVHKGCVAFWS